MTTTNTPVTTTETMKAMVQTGYGPVSEVFEIADVPKPVPADDEILIKVHSSSVNALEWHFMAGQPLLFRPVFGVTKPKNSTLGADVAGTVEAVGRDVTGFEPGDAVFGDVGAGSYAEYVIGHARHLTHKPAGVTLEEVAAVPVAGLTALQFLRDIADVQPGQKVLVNGASGGVGTYAVQIAKHMGTEVTAVTSTGNLEQATALGADHVVDYTTEDVADLDARYDAILDIGGLKNLRTCKKLLTPTGIYTLVGGSKNSWVGPIPRFLGGFVYFMFGSKRFGQHTAVSRSDDLAELGALLESGAIKSAIAATYPVNEVGEQIDRQGTFHSRGKTVINVADSGW